MNITDMFDFKNRTEEFSPLALAFMGDAVFELFVRTYVLSEGNRAVDKMNTQGRSLVNAHAQALMYHKIEEILTDEEHSVLRRGRNANSHTMAKNQTAGDYRHATGLEALFGYLYLKGSVDRLKELFLICLEQGDN